MPPIPRTCPYRQRAVRGSASTGARDRCQPSAANASQQRQRQNFAAATGSDSGSCDVDIEIGDTPDADAPPSPPLFAMSNACSADIVTTANAPPSPPPPRLRPCPPLALSTLPRPPRQLLTQPWPPTPRGAHRHRRRRGRPPWRRRNSYVTQAAPPTQRRAQTRRPRHGRPRCRHCCATEARRRRSNSTRAPPASRAPAGLVEKKKSVGRWMGGLTDGLVWHLRRLQVGWV
eukprot:247333-Chlamydomonas_euryale.AAC.2